MKELYEQMQLEVLPAESAPAVTDESQSQTQPEAAPTAGGPAVYEDFGCCSRFRQCSDARACLIPDRAYSKSCIYRKSLEAGNIFYGKNAGCYRPEVYRSFAEKYRSLSIAEANVLHSVLNYTFVVKPASMSIMTASVSEFSNLLDMGFFRLTMHPGRLMKRCTLNAMVAACGDRIKDANQWVKSNFLSTGTEEAWNKRRKTQKDVGPDIKILREELVNWISLFHPEIAEKLPSQKGKWTVSLMVDACGEYILDANQYAKVNCSSEAEWTGRKGTSIDVGPDIRIYKDELERWILNFSPDIFSELSKGVSFIEFDSDSRFELNEFFLDYIYQKQCMPTLATCEDDPRFLSRGKEQ